MQITPSISASTTCRRRRRMVACEVGAQARTLVGWRASSRLFVGRTSAGTRENVERRGLAVFFRRAFLAIPEGAATAESPEGRGRS